MQTGSKELIRDINTALVLRTIITDGPLSRADISKKLGLTKATISSIVQPLLDRSLVFEDAPASSAVGRKPIPLSFNEKCGSVISVNLESSTISILLSDLNGGSCIVREFPNEYDGKTILPFLEEAILNLVKIRPESCYGLIGIAIGIHGVVHKGEILFTPYRNYKQVDFAGHLGRAFGVPVLIENEANLSAIGEHTFCYPAKDIINISIHTGIGLGLILNDRLYVGHDGYAGEFGHTIVVPDGRPCPCGNRGCLEQYASEHAILKEVAAKKHLRKLSGDEFARLYEHGDPDAVAGMKDFIKYIGIGINNILNSFNPEILVINSSFTMNFPSTLPEIEKELRNRMRNTCRILPSTLQDMAILLGGVVTVRNNFLGI
ncbi:MAG TPA: ROK family transcriptional regulator [Lachnospiraceae bacterium]|nr:ROK family transcriptional regulator [Lachnospiraceae bacterium]